MFYRWTAFSRRRTISRMKRIIPMALLTAVLLGSLGCVPQNDEIQSEDQPEPYVLQRENKKLKRKVKDLRAENKSLVDHNKSVRKRAEKLSTRLHNLKRDYEKRKEIIEHLKHLPAERDRYKKEAYECRMTIFRLNREISQLKGKLAELQPSKPKPVPK